MSELENAASEYNYEHFPRDMDEPAFERFREVLPPGSPAPTGTVVDASSGQTVELSTLWSAGHAVLEFGSAT